VGQVGPGHRVLLWWIAGAWVIAAAGACLLAGGWSWLRRFTFPLLFLLLALPIPERFENPIQLGLKRVTTTLAETGLRASGMTVQRDGFELKLPSGGLEVVEACSGVRSVTALLAISIFISYLRGFGLIRGVFMVVGAFPVIIAVNALRIMLTGWIQEWFGPEWARGNPHEYLGFFMVFVGLCLCLLLAELMRPREMIAVPADSTEKPPEKPAPNQLALIRVPAAWLAAMILVATTATSIYACCCGNVRAVNLSHAAPIEQTPLVIGAWTGKDLPIAPEISKELLFDKAVYRTYTDPFGREITVWILLWESKTAVHGYHHPDTCMGVRGYNCALKTRQLAELPAGGQLRLTVRRYERGQQCQLVHYWTQEGNHVWSQEDEDKADKNYDAHHDWILYRLVEQPPSVASRLTVIVQAEQWNRREGSDSDKVLLEFTKELAERLYELCPWLVNSDE
jgi:exosortase